MKRAERLHALTEELRRSGRRGRTARELADQFGVSVRTIVRDLDSLEVSGAPLWARPGPGGGYGLVPGSTMPPIALTPAQAVALLTAVAAAPDAPYSDLAAAGVRKVMDVLDPQTRGRAAELAGRIWVDTDPTPTRSVTSAVEEAMVQQRVVRIRYSSASGEASARDVEPILFGSTGGRWYLVACCRLRQAVRWFRISRITSATVTGTPCTGHTIEDVGPPPPSARPVA